MFSLGKRAFPHAGYLGNHSVNQCYYVRQTLHRPRGLSLRGPKATWCNIHQSFYTIAAKWMTLPTRRAGNLHCNHDMGRSWKVDIKRNATPPSMLTLNVVSIPHRQPHSLPTLPLSLLICRHGLGVELARRRPGPCRRRKTVRPVRRHWIPRLQHLPSRHDLRSAEPLHP